MVNPQFHIVFLVGVFGSGLCIAQAFERAVELLAMRAIVIHLSSFI